MESEGLRPVKKRPLTVPILSLTRQTSPNRISSKCVLILSSPSTPVFHFKWSLCFRCQHQNPEGISSRAMRSTRPAHLTSFDLLTQITFGETTNHQASHYAVFSSCLLQTPSLVHIRNITSVSDVPADAGSLSGNAVILGDIIKGTHCTFKIALCRPKRTACLSVFVPEYLSRSQMRLGCVLYHGSSFRNPFCHRVKITRVTSIL
jgi:hypothetical protein